MLQPRASFEKSLLVAFQRAAKEDVDDLGTCLAHQIGVAQVGASALAIDYRERYEADRDWLFLVFHTEGFYHQLYDAITTASVLVGQFASPPLRVVSLAKLSERLAVEPSHPLAAKIGAIANAVDLLTWFCEVRHKGLQHRAENRYTGNRGIVESDAIAVYRSREPLPADRLSGVWPLYTKMAGKYGWRWRPNTNREALMYLDWGSHLIYAYRPKDFKACRFAVERAKAYDLVASQAVLKNVDAALARLIALAPSRRPREDG
jgi:hypothetical protein